YVEGNKELAYAAIIEIGISPLKAGVIDGGPVFFSDDADVKNIIESLKEFARKNNYMHLQIRPPTDSLLNTCLKNDDSFETKIYFPFHLKVEFDLNIYNKPERELLAGFKMQCRRKIVLAGRLPYRFSKVEDDAELENLRNLFKKVTDVKGYNFLPFKIYEAIYKEGKKYNLCDFYVVHLNGELINAVMIVKDGKSFYHYTSALVVNGFKPSESPPAKLHHYVMEDCFYNEHKDFYDISFGGSDNLIRFKELFNPIEIEKPPYYTYVIKRKTLNFLSKFSPEQATSLRKFFKKF
ncbi:MAG: GNAT family N-acetyltransferase, partial [Parafilimonas sp.]